MRNRTLRFAMTGELLFVIARPQHALKLLFTFVAEAISTTKLCKL
jgi:hypothetical protein